MQIFTQTKQIPCLLFACFALSLPVHPLQADSIELEGRLMKAVAAPRVSEAATHLIEGIILVRGGVDLNFVQREHGVHIELDQLAHAKLKKALEEFMNRPFTADAVQEIKRTVTNYFLTVKKTYVATIIPVQEITDGVIVLEVLEGRLGNVKYTQQKWFSESALKRSFKMKKGDPIIESDLLNYVTWLNRNPFHFVQMVLSPGTEKGYSDLEFISKERFPVRFFTGADNTGYRANSQTRLYGGFNWGNTFMIGDLLSYQYTASPNFHDFQSHVFNYTSFLSWKNVLSVFGCYGTLFPNIPNFKTSGKNIQLSGRYQVPFKPLYGDFRHTFTSGFDWKYLTSNLFFAGNPAEALGTTTSSNPMINITQFMTGYSCQSNWPTQALSFSAEIYASVWKDWLPHQTSAAYNQMRLDSHVRYAYLRTSLSDKLNFAGCVFSGLFRGQLASQTLPTSEQFGLGGADTVRGYYEQQFVADNALVVNLEFYSPTLSLFKSNPNELSFLVFTDYGYGRNYTYASEPYQQQHLLGIGPGLRYDIIPYMSLKADYGFQVIGIPQDHRFGRFHLSLQVSY